MAGKQAAVKKEKKNKKWYPITAPSFFRDQVLGEIPSSSISNLVGRKISINLMSATRDFKHQDVNITFSIDSVQGQTAIASVNAYRQSLSSLKRLVRRKTDRIDTRVIVKTKDNSDAIVKVVMISLNNTYSKVLTKLRKAAHDNLIAACKELTFVDLIQSVINNKLARDIKQLLNKVFPVRMIVVTSVVLVKPELVINRMAKAPEANKPVEELVAEEKPVEQAAVAEEAAEEPAEKKPRKPRAKKKPAEENPAEEKPVEENEPVEENPSE